MFTPRGSLSTCNYYEWFTRPANAFIEQDSSSSSNDDADEVKLLGYEDLMNFRASLIKEARLSSARVEVGDELEGRFSEICGVKVLESDEENSWCMPNLFRGVFNGNGGC